MGIGNSALFPLIPAQAGIQCLISGSPLEFIPDLIGDGDERLSTFRPSALGRVSTAAMS